MEENRIDDVIGEIFKIEKAAVGIQEDADREIEEYTLEIEAKIKEYDEKLERETSEKLDRLEKELEEEKEKKISVMRADILKQTERLEQMYEANHEKWVNEIVGRIVNER